MRRLASFFLLIAVIGGLAGISLPAQDAMAAGGCDWSKSDPNQPYPIGVTSPPTASRANSRFEIDLTLQKGCGSVDMELFVAQSREVVAGQDPYEYFLVTQATTLSDNNPSAHWHQQATPGTKYWIRVFGANSSRQTLYDQIWGPLTIPTSGATVPSDCTLILPEGTCNHRAVDTADPGIVQSATDSLMTNVTKWFVEGAAGLLNGGWALMKDSSTSSLTNPEFNQQWFEIHFGKIAFLAALLMVPFLFASIVYNALRGNGAEIAKCLFYYLPLATVLTVLVATFTGALLSVVDGWTWWVVSDDQAVIDGYVRDLHDLILTGGDQGGVPAGVAAVAGILLTIGSLGIFIELVIREAAIYIVVLFSPFMFAGMVWTWARPWVTKTIELLVVLVFSKFVIVVVTVAGALAIVNSGDSLLNPHGATGEGAIRSLIAGGILFLTGAFSVGALFKLLPVMESGLAYAHEHARRQLGNLGSRIGNRAAGAGVWAATGLGGAGLKLAGNGLQAAGGGIQSISGSNRGGQAAGRLTAALGHGLSATGRLVQGGPLRTASQSARPRPQEPPVRPPDPPKEV